MSDSLQPHGLKHARLPSPSLFPGACSNLCPLSQWCHPTISSSVVPFSSSLQRFLMSVISLHQVAKVLELQLRHQSCQWIFRVISFRKTANLDDVLYLAVTNLSVYFLFCEFPDLLKLGQESSYLYKRYLVQKSDYYRLYIEQKRKTKQL